MRLITPLPLFAAFVVANAILLALAQPEATYLQGGDAALYMGPARALVELGWLASSPEQPDIPLSFAPPLYSFFLAVPVALLPWKSALLAVVLLQLGLLWATGRIARALVPASMPMAAPVVQTLVTLNPSALITAHLVQSETLFTFFITAALATILKLAAAPRPGLAAACGLAVGLAALTRPVAQYAIPLLPFIMLILRSPARTPPAVAASLKSALVAAVIASACVAPWWIRNHAIFGEYLYTTNGGFYLSDQYVEVLQVDRGLSGQQASQARYRMIEEGLRARGITDFEHLPAHTRSRITLELVLPEFLALPVSSHLRTFGRALLNLYFSGGASNFSNYLGIEATTPAKFLQHYQSQGIATMFRDFASATQGAFAAFTVLLLLFAATMRVLGLQGILTLWQHEEWPRLLLIIGQLLFFTAMYLHLGQSRFRIPLEPALMSLAAVGIADLLQKWRIRADQSHR